MEESENLFSPINQNKIVHISGGQRLGKTQFAIKAMSNLQGIIYCASEQSEQRIREQAKQLGIKINTSYIDKR